MIKIISKKKYEEYLQIIDEQDKQIDELIEMVKDSRRRTTHAVKCYCDLLELIDEYVENLPKEISDNIHEIRTLIKEEG